MLCDKLMEWTAYRTISNFKDIILIIATLTIQTKNHRQILVWATIQVREAEHIIILEISCIPLIWLKISKIMGWSHHKCKEELDKVAQSILDLGQEVVEEH